MDGAPILCIEMAQNKAYTLRQIKLDDTVPFRLTPGRVRFETILLQKSFCTRDQNFFWLYTRLSCKDVGDLIA
jgi:uncharacterized protein GlcG (DUF336 family)